jgi:hypothetical protein
MMADRAPPNQDISLDDGREYGFELFLLGLYFFAARGVFVASKGVFHDRLHGACLGLPLGTSLYFLAVTAAMGGLSGGARYRHPVMPFACILASAGLRSRKTLAG